MFWIHWREEPSVKFCEAFPLQCIPNTGLPVSYKSGVEISFSRKVCATGMLRDWTKLAKQISQVEIGAGGDQWWVGKWLLHVLSHVWLFVTLWTVAHQAPLSMGISPGKNTGVVCHALLQGIFPTQESNPGFPHCRLILYHLSHQGSPVSWNSSSKSKMFKVKWWLRFFL